MTTVVAPIDEKLRARIKKALRANYSDKNSFAFAIAMYRGLGWPLQAFFAGKPLKPIRAGVCIPKTGGIFDARGPVGEDDFAGTPRLTTAKHRDDIGDIREGEVYAMFKIVDSQVERARLWAEMLWPDLPWEEPRLRKEMRFADELEALSRKYGLWITGVSVGLAPIVHDSKGDESGYILETTNYLGTTSITTHLHKPGKIEFHDR